MTRVLLADDQELVRAGFRLILELAGLEVVGEAGDGAEAVELARRLDPDVVLIGEVQRKPVVEGDRIVPRSVVTLGCTFDHRTIDGAQGTAIAAVLRRVVEDPEKELGPVPARSTAATGTEAL